KPYYPRQEYGDRGYPQARQYTSLNDTKVHVLEEIMATGLENLPPTRDKGIMMGPDGNAWCAYHKCKGHETERCFRL
ncbi:hypothetical protein A2U01_0074054, partial [Trifolium medium]|nr:hypothetical protein [Trifolium medium]